jgi:hypothetical protein
MRVGDESSTGAASAEDALHAKLRGHRQPEEHDARQEIGEVLRRAPCGMLCCQNASNRVRGPSGYDSKRAIVRHRTKNGIRAGRHLPQI